MAEKILGIDLGSSAVKLVQLSWSFRTVQLCGYASARLPAAVEASLVAQLIRDLIDENQLESDRCLLALSSGHSFLRRLSFPFSSGRKIGQVIEYELEPCLPVGLDGVRVAFVRTRRLPDAGQEVLAAAFLREVLDPLLAELQNRGIEPEVVDLDGHALSLIAHEYRSQLAEHTVVVDLGRSKTNVLYCLGGQLVYLRPLGIGVGHLARRLAASLRLSEDAALERLFAMRVDEPEGDPKVERMHAAVGAEIELLAREIEISLMAAQENLERPELVLLSGGGSLIKVVPGALERALDLPVRTLQELGDGGVMSQLGGQTGDLPVYAVAAGLALRGTNRRSGFNFQARQWPTGQFLSKWRPHLAYALVAGLLVALSWLASVGVELHTEKQRLLRLDQGIEAVFHRALPGFSGAVRPEQYASILKTKIKELGHSGALLGNGAGSYSAVELLRTLSQAIPRSLDVTLKLLTMDGQHVRLTGRADGFSTVDVIKKRLVATGRFSQVNIAGAKTAAAGKGVRFSLELLSASRG